MQRETTSTRKLTTMIDIEELATRTMIAAETFARDCSNDSRVSRSLSQAKILCMIQRLEAGQVIDDRDDHVIARIGAQLVEQANALRSGYGDRALAYETYHDFCVTDEMDGLRIRIQNFEVLARRRCELRNRFKARALLDTESGVSGAAGI